jgi:hypothetical protein
MKYKIKYAAFLLIAVFALAGCKKEKNQPPIANAGVDQTIILPTDSIAISGSGTDADGSVVSYSWSKTSGPSSFSIINPNIAVIKIKNLVKGEYVFELKVTDNLGLTATDAVIVKVDFQVNIQLIRVGTLSINRVSSAAATSGNKILFAGGHRDDLSMFSRVDIYDMVSKTWSTAILSEARTGIGAVTVGNKILFAGGAKNFNYDDGWYNLTTRVDIYDVSTNSWTTTELPEPLNFIDQQGATAVVGNEAFFCAASSTKMFIYDVVTNSWSSVQLSTYKSQLVAPSVGNKILIAGEGSNQVDIYDASANTWSVNSLSEVRGYLIAATLNNKAFFAGGGLTNRVDIYDDVTQSWSVDSLNRPSGVLATVLCGGAASLGQKMLFFGSNLVDIYDSALNTWSITDITQNFCSRSTIIAAGDNIYATNGQEVWKIQL